ncbi:MAG: YggT family protein [Nitrospirales bacterium]|nr:YggT family protein [Nitrospira sp.]MDR4500457.1 YggT family protein [Nitrospirales bacterium]
MGYFSQAAIFLIDLIFGLYVLAILLRFLLQRAGADFYNPISQLLYSLTNPALQPLRRLVPAVGGIDWATIVLLFLVQGAELSLIAWLGSGHLLPLPGLLILTLASLLKLAIYIYIFLLIIQVVISWINPGAYNPITGLMYQVTEPLLRPARRLVPPAGGFDWSVLVVLVCLQLALILLVSPIEDLGYRLSSSMPQIL